MVGANFFIQVKRSSKKDLIYCYGFIFGAFILTKEIF
jgi:hypothetical protein